MWTILLVCSHMLASKTFRRTNIFYRWQNFRLLSLVSFSVWKRAWKWDMCLIYMRQNFHSNYYVSTKSEPQNFPCKLEKVEQKVHVNLRRNDATFMATCMDTCSWPQWVWFVSRLFVFESSFHDYQMYIISCTDELHMLSVSSWMKTAEVHHFIMCIVNKDSNL